MDDFSILLPVAGFLGIVGFYVLVLAIQAYIVGYTFYTCTYSKPELLRILNRNYKLGKPVHQADIGLYKVAGHKSLYPDKIPINPNFFEGRMTLQQFAQVMIFINSAIIECLIGEPKVVCCDYGTTIENQRTACYYAANVGCRQATDYLQQNNVRVVVFQTTDNQTNQYVNGRYQRVIWDTSINISFRDEDILRVQASTVIDDGVAVNVANNKPHPLKAAPVMTTMVAQVDMFPNLNDPRALKIAYDLRKFYDKFEPGRSGSQIEASASWAADSGVDALNEKLREKYGHDLNILREAPPV